MANVKQIKINDTVYDVEDSVARSALEQKAPLESPALTGIPTAPTASNGTNTTQVATTAFVQNAVQGAGGSYKLPVASSTTLGGVKPVSKTASMTQEVGVDASGALYTEPGSGGGGSTDISLGITGAAVGQTVKVKAVDADGKPTAWEAVDTPSGGSMRWQKIKEITLAEQTNDIVIDEDDNGVSVADYNPIAMKVEFIVPADSTQTNANGVPWIYPSATFIDNSIRAIGSLASWKTVTRRQVEFFIGDIYGIYAGGNVDTQLVPEPSNRPNITFMDGVKLHINNTGDHWPVGTIVSLEVLSGRA